MNQNLWNEVDNYIDQKLIHDEIMERVLVKCHNEGLPPINVSPTQGKMLMQLARLMGANKVLEVGTLGGYSTLWMAKGLGTNGMVITLEIEPHYANVARKNFESAGLSHLIEVREGKALELLPQIADQNIAPFDMVFIDADKINNSAYFEWALKLSRPGTLIIVDNVVRGGDVINDRSDNPSIIGTRKVFDFIANDARVEATALQTVGLKGYDGFVMAIVKAT